MDAACAGVERRPPMARVANIEIVEPDPDDCTPSLPPEGNVKLRNYRMLSENLRAYTPTGDIHTSPTKGKLVAKFDVWGSLSPPRARILELLRPEDPGRDALEAIVRPAPRRGLARPLDDDTRRFLQRALLSPSPQGLSNANTPEPHANRTDSPESERAESRNTAISITPDLNHNSETQKSTERSLADELREAEEEERSGHCVKRDILRDWRIGWEGKEGEASERERLGRLALAVEEDEAGEAEGLSAAARRLDALLAESRGLHEELAAIHEDIQAACVRACRCAAAARALERESRALRYLDDVVALLRGELHAAQRARAWPFALGRRDPRRSYVV